jgi:O-Antigen ligase.
MKKIKKILGLEKFKLSVNDYFLLSLPVAVWFSYHPLIEFGKTATMYLEISISLAVLLLFAITALPHVWKVRQKLVQKKSTWLIAGFALWNSLTVFWSENPLRGFLTAGVVWLIAIAYFRIITHPKIKQLAPALFRILVVFAVVMSVFSWIQMVLDIAGVPMENTLICIGCQYEYFGFPRATAMAIEPQFFGSLLLAPTLILLSLIYKSKAAWWHYVVTGFLVLTLFMTLSRGAIYALAIGVLVLIIIKLKSFRKNLIVIGLSALCMTFSLISQGLMVVANQNVGESFSFGITKSIHHLSLGVIDFREKAVEIEQNLVPNDEIEIIETGEAHIYFDGYVAESTDARLSFNELAFNAWKKSPFSIIFGVGLGGAGVAMYKASPDQIGQLEITQNEYTELPLEIGLVGFGIFLVMVALFFYETRQTKWVWSIMAAFLVQWMFFSGYPNAIHIYLTLFMLLTSMTKNREV